MYSLSKIFRYLLLSFALVLPGAFAVVVVAVARKWVLKEKKT